MGLTIFTTLFTRFSAQASASMTASISMLRPEVVQHVASTKMGLLARGVDGHAAELMTSASLHQKVVVQGLVVGFEKSFLFQAGLFLLVVPLLFFLRTSKRTTSPPEPIHIGE